MWDLPGPGLKHMSPALAGRFLTTAPPGKPRVWGSISLNSFKFCFYVYCMFSFNCWDITEHLTLIRYGGTISSHSIQFNSTSIYWLHYARVYLGCWAHVSKQYRTNFYPSVSYTLYIPQFCFPHQQFSFSSMISFLPVPLESFRWKVVLLSNINKNKTRKT